MDRTQLRMIFLGRWFDAGVEPPNTSPADRRGMARWMREKCARPTLFPDPLHFVVKLGLRPVERRITGFGCECTDGHTIVYPPFDDARERGVRLYHGLAHCILLRHGWIHSEADAWLLTGELALPTCEARRVRTIEEAFEEQQWATHWLLLFQIASVRLQRKAA